MITVENVSFSYKRGEPLLENISISIKKGSFTALAGRNGSGKTTLTRLLMGLEKADSGSIVFEGKDITNISAAKRGRFIGYVFQQPDRQMFKNTVFEEIAFAPIQKGLPPKDVKEITERILERTGLTAYRDAYPMQLRRGVKQRIAIASALAMESKFLILDEPTSGQDCNEKKEIIDLLCKLNKEGLTILLVTHDMDIINAHCETVFVLRQGQMVFEGLPKELFSKEREALKRWGLVKPVCVALSEFIEGCPYCKSMEALESYLTRSV